MRTKLAALASTGSRLSVRRSPINPSSVRSVWSGAVQLGIVWQPAGGRDWRASYAFIPAPGRICFAQTGSQYSSEDAAVDGLLDALAKLPVVECPLRPPAGEEERGHDLPSTGNDALVEQQLSALELAAA